MIVQSSNSRRPAIPVDEYLAQQTPRARERAADEYIRRAQRVREVCDARAERSASVGSVEDVDGNAFEVGFHFFPDEGSVDRLVTLGEYGTAVRAENIPELIRLLTAATEAVQSA